MAHRLRSAVTMDGNQFEAVASSGQYATAAQLSVNHLLLREMEPAVTQQNFEDTSLSN